MRRLIYTIDYLPSGEVTPALSLCKRHMCLPPLPLSFPVGQASAAETLKSIARLAAAAACSFAVPLNVRAHSAARGEIMQIVKLSKLSSLPSSQLPSLSSLSHRRECPERRVYAGVKRRVPSLIENDRKSRLDMSEAKRRMSTTCKGVNEPFFGSLLNRRQQPSSFVGRRRWRCFAFKRI